LVCVPLDTENCVAAEQTTLHTTAGGTRVFVERGTKSPFDFKVRYQEAEGRARTPKHIHLVIDLYLKAAGNPALTIALVDYFLETVWGNLVPVNTYPPALQVFKPSAISQFAPLDQFGEYDVEFLLVVTELIMIQERTNYPAGTMTPSLFQAFRNSKVLGGTAGIFGVVGAATFTGPS
jgi:hypothetical protein